MQAYGNVTVYTSRPETQDELVERIRQAHTVVNIRAYCKFTAEGVAGVSALATSGHLGYRHR